MNALQISGGIVSIVGTVLMFIGSYRQGLGDQKFQGKVEDFVEEQNDSNIPELVALNITREGSDFILTIKNVGHKPATKVKVLYSENSTPNIFSANMISGAQEIPQNTEYALPLNLFSGVNLIMKLPATDDEYKKTLQSSLDKFNAGEIALIPRFYIEYYHGDQRFTSPIYYLLLESKRGLLTFGKETTVNIN